MAATEEDFSFPTTTDTPPRFIESPRLWRTTSLVSRPDHETPRKEDDDGEDFNFLCYYASNKKSKYGHQRKSFSHIECGMKTTRREDVKYSSDHDGGDHDEENEKMDILWEDFNEEFSRNSKSSSSMSDFDHHHQGKMLNFGCVQSLKLSRPNKKPSVVEFMKVLKKMFLLQNSRRSLKKTQR